MGLKTAFSALLLLCVAVASPGRRNVDYQFTFTCNEPITGSLGVFDSESPPVLVRTLSGPQFYSTGTHLGTWDGTDDFGVLVTANSPYTLKVLTHNVNVSWEGVIGNSCHAQTGPTHMQWLATMQDVMSIGTKVYVLRDYNEVSAWVWAGLTSDPNYLTVSGGVLSRNIQGTTGYTPQSITTDGTYIYAGFAGVGSFGGPVQSAIGRYKVDETAAPVFSGVTPITGTGEGQNNSGAWILTASDASGKVQSLAVQTTGTYLCAAEKFLNQVQVYDKNTGLAASISTLSLSNVNCVRWSLDETILWASSGTSVFGYTNNGSVFSLAYTITGPGSNVESMAVDRVTGNLAVLYTATEERVHIFSPDSTTDIQQLGTVDAYNGDPNVTDSKWLIPSPYSAGGICYQPDGQLWVLDFGNDRILRFNTSVSLTSANCRISIAGPYSLSTDPNTPTRVIGTPGTGQGSMEFNRNWSIPLSTPSVQGIHPGWTLVKNWGYGLTGTLSNNNGLVNVVTMSNGRVYGRLVQTGSLVELTSTGLRTIGAYSSVYPANPGGVTLFKANIQINPNGNLFALNVASNVATYYTATLVGFTTGNPHWNAWTTYCTCPSTANSPNGGAWFGNGGLQFPTLANGDLVTAKVPAWNQTTPSSYFLGIVPSGASSYRVQTAQGQVSTPKIPNARVAWDSVGGDGGTPAGDGVLASGNIFAYMQNGEFFANGEANQILIYHSSGLPIAQVGTSFVNGNGLNVGFHSASGMSGNFNGCGLVDPGDGTLRLVHASESGGQGYHEWKLSNLSTIQVTSGTLSASSTLNLSISAVGNVPSPPTTDGVIFDDNFIRANSSTVGNGWTDVTNNYRIQGNNCQNNGGFGATRNVGQGALLRPQTIANSYQKITIPAAMWNYGSSTFFSPNTIQSAWGLVSRYQSSNPLINGQNSRSYIACASWNSTPLGGVFANPPGNFGNIGLYVGLCDWSNGFGIFNTDNVPPTNLTWSVDNPGHSYSLEFWTWQDVLNNRTNLRATLRDDVTKQVLVTLNNVSDEPGLQGTGQVGLSGSVTQALISSYKLR